MGGLRCIGLSTAMALVNGSEHQSMHRSGAW